MSSWEKFVRKYVWDENTTPFLIPVRRLNRGQARKELFLFVVFLATPFAMIALAAVAAAPKVGPLAAGLAAAYAVSVIAATFALNATKHWLPALYCGTAPLAVMLYLVVFGFSPKLQFIDEALILVILLGWLRYTVRIVAIARAYPQLPEAADGPSGSGDHPSRR